MGTKDNLLFRVTSAFMVIGGAVGMILGIVAILDAGTLAALLGSAARFGLLMAGSIAVWASGAAGLIAGITGVKNAGQPGNAMVCIVFGSLAAVLCALGSVLMVMGGGQLSAASLITGLLFPVLYLIVVFKSKGRHG